MKSLRRLLAVILKECTQIERDPSILLIGLFLPIFLLMLFGYGLSMDVKGVPVAIVTEDPSPLTTRITDRFFASDYFAAQKVESRIEAEALLRNREVDAVLHFPSDFTRHVLAGEQFRQGAVEGRAEQGGAGPHAEEHGQHAAPVQLEQPPAPGQHGAHFQGLGRQYQAALGIAVGQPARPGGAHK